MSQVRRRTGVVGKVAAVVAISIFGVARGEDVKVDLAVHVDQAKGGISPEIYGQFAEHLGHCIYGGVWVGEDSKIPNVRGIRKDVVGALKAARVPVIRWPGGCF